MEFIYEILISDFLFIHFSCFVFIMILFFLFFYFLHLNFAYVVYDYIFIILKYNKNGLNIFTTHIYSLKAGQYNFFFSNESTLLLRKKVKNKKQKN